MYLGARNYKEADVFLDFLNSQYVKVKWTREIAKDKVLPYLVLDLEKR